MTSRMRELIQQLGEAIHESVIESEQIAGVVQDIRHFLRSLRISVEGEEKDGVRADTDEADAE